MANRDNKRFMIETFEINDIVTIQIPKKDRSTLDHCRVYAYVIACQHDKPYQLQ